MTKRLLPIILIALLGVSACNNASIKNKAKGQPKIQFYDTEHDFGMIMEGEKVMHNFKFKNIGKGDLIIKNAKAGCGCTIPKFSNKPIPSGEEGAIEVVFNSSNRDGFQQKHINVWTNAQEEPFLLRITCEINKQ